MKLRLSFVSNSSSSSYTCDVCRETSSGWDMDLAEAEMYECENGHIVHENCGAGGSEILDVTDMGPTEQLAFLQGAVAAKWITSSEKLKGLINDLTPMSAQEIDESPLQEELLDTIRDIADEFRWDLPHQFCPVCRMEYVIDRDLIGYLVKLTGKSIDAHCSEMMDRFSTYNELWEFIK